MKSIPQRNLELWFGASKLKDNSGRPIVLFHATQSDFDIFETDRETTNAGTFGSWTTSRSAIFLTPDPMFAAEFAGKTGHIMPLFARLENPIDMRGSAIWDYADQLAEHGISARWLTSRSDTEMWELFDDENGQELVRVAKLLGFDGAIMRERAVGGNAVEVFVVFDPDQLKSAIGNSGRFDKNSKSLTDQEFTP